MQEPAQPESRPKKAPEARSCRAFHSCRSASPLTIAPAIASLQWDWMPLGRAGGRHGWNPASGAVGILGAISPEQRQACYRPCRSPPMPADCGPNRPSARARETIASRQRTEALGCPGHPSLAKLYKMGIIQRHEQLCLAWKARRDACRSTDVALHLQSRVASYQETPCLCW
jgi:hypothetical protein